MAQEDHKNHNTISVSDNDQALMDNFSNDISSRLRRLQWTQSLHQPGSGNSDHESRWSVAEINKINKNGSPPQLKVALVISTNLNKPVGHRSEKTFILLFDLYCLDQVLLKCFDAENFDFFMLCMILRLSRFETMYIFRQNL